tara:strand:- start:696 stop:1010 length:315 start_codon:yes stop_codon:yes gene_type:complete
MPTYRFYNKRTKKEYTDLMSISEMEEFIKKKHIKLLPPTQLNIVSSTGTIDGKADSGWKEVMSKISEAHPKSPLADRYGKRSVKDTQIDSVIKKHKAKRQGKKV